MMNDELLNAVIAAGTSVLVVILSHILIRQKEKAQIIENNEEKFFDNYVNPIRFMLAENYYRIREIIEQVKEDDQEKKDKNKILVVDCAEDVMNKDSSWFIADGCYLISTCYLTACLFYHMENIREGIPFFKMSRYEDTKLLELINKLVVDFSNNLNIYYVVQMNIGKEFYIKEEKRILTYREFCELLRNKDDFEWYKKLIDYYLRVEKGEYKQAEYLLIHIKELAKFLDKIVSGGDSIRQKELAEEEAKNTVNSGIQGMKENRCLK